MKMKRRLLIFAAALAASALFAWRARAAGGMDLPESPMGQGAEGAAMPSIGAWSFPESVTPVSESLEDGLKNLAAAKPGAAELMAAPALPQALAHMLSSMTRGPENRKMLGLLLDGAPHGKILEMLKSRSPELGSALQAAYERNAGRISQAVNARAFEVARAALKAAAKTGGVDDQAAKEFLKAQIELRAFDEIAGSRETVDKAISLCSAIHDDGELSQARAIAAELLAGGNKDAGASLPGWEGAVEEIAAADSALASAPERSGLKAPEPAADMTPAREAVPEAQAAAKPFLVNGVDYRPLMSRFDLSQMELAKLSNLMNDRYFLKAYENLLTETSRLAPRGTQEALDLFGKQMRRWRESQGDLPMSVLSKLLSRPGAMEEHAAALKSLGTEENYRALTGISNRMMEIRTILKPGNSAAPAAGMPAAVPENELAALAAKARRYRNIGLAVSLGIMASLLQNFGWALHVLAAAGLSGLLSGAASMSVNPASGARISSKAAAALGGLLGLAAGAARFSLYGAAGLAYTAASGAIVAAKISRSSAGKGMTAGNIIAAALKGMISAAILPATLFSALVVYLGLGPGQAGKLKDEFNRKDRK